jgi:hypothetical protein
LLARAKKGERFSLKSAEIRKLNTLYQWEELRQIPAVKKRPSQLTFQL